jgi:1,2-diacylglycerol 3-beta-glucosyltransferase
MIVAAAVVALASAPVFLAALYLGALALFARRTATPPDFPPTLRFDVVVPAHDEESCVARTVASLLSIDYPAPLRRVVVVADNCHDETATRAWLAGANVIIRNDPRPLGKGGALAEAFAHSLSEGVADAVVVVDADTVVSPNLLRAFNARLLSGDVAVQADYAVANPTASWRTRMTALGFALFHGLRSLARDRLGLSCGLRGNGMCLATKLLRAVPWTAFSVVEDLEYGITLGEAGQRVRYAAETRVLGDMPRAEAASRSQRTRWERGRRAVASARTKSLLARGIGERNPVLVDLALDLLVPPLARLTGAALLGTAIAAGVAAATGLRTPLLPWIATDLCLGLYVLKGCLLSDLGLGGLAALLSVPRYLVWKAGLWLKRPRGPLAWVKTAREGRSA